MTFTPNTPDRDRSTDTATDADTAAHADRTTGTETANGTLTEVSHTNPYTDESFGLTQVYRRGRIVAADGGRDSSVEPGQETGSTDDAEDPEQEESEDEQLKDVDHTPPKDAESANRVHQRGSEGPDESV